jgi:hypothetical protein
VTAVHRVFLSVYSILWAAACVGLIFMAWNEDKKLDIGGEQLNIQGFVAADGAERWAFTFLMAGLALVGVVTLVIALAEGTSTSRGLVRVRQVGGGVVELPATALAAAVAKEMARQPDVRRAGAVVTVTSGSIHTELSLTVEPEASIARVTKGAAETVARVYREEVGATAVARPRVRITYEEPVDATIDVPHPGYPTNEPSQRTAYIFASALGPDGRRTDEAFIVPPPVTRAPEQILWGEEIGQEAEEAAQAHDRA